MLLLDQNLSYKIIPALQKHFPGAVHVRTLALEQQSDEEIWEHARQHSLTIVTNDDDFETLAAYRGFPPKVIQLVRGNLSRAEIERILVENAEKLKEFVDSEIQGYLALG